MDLLADLAKFKEEHGLEFLVIGGHAVNVHGYSRRTLDLDVLIPKTKAEVWKQHVLAIGCTLLFEANNFIQFNSADEKSWPLDFMLVNEETFSKLLKRRTTGRYLWCSGEGPVRTSHHRPKTACSKARPASSNVQRHG